MASGLRLAPSFAHALARTALILLAAAAIGAASYVSIGAPSRARLLEDRQGGPYGPTLPFGLVQLLGQSALLGAGVFVARRWLRVRL